MWDHGWHMSWMWYGWIIVLVAIAAVVWLFSRAASGGARLPAGGPGDPETVLKGRYARGEIDREEYQRRLQDLRQ
jgi:putative membrane protein